MAMIMGFMMQGIRTLETKVFDTALLIDVMKQELKAQEMTYADVAVALEISESSVKRMFSKKEMPLTRVDDICRMLNTNFAELSRRVSLATPLTSGRTAPRWLHDDCRVSALGVFCLYGLAARHQRTLVRSTLLAGVDNFVVHSAQ
jgi:DNA-binding Xre family transcriptional regulator